MGGPNGFANAQDSARVALPSRGTVGGAACVYQENASNARWRFGIGTQAEEGAATMSKKRGGQQEAYGFEHR